MQTEFGSPAAAVRDYYRRQAEQGQAKAEPIDGAAVDAQCAELVSRHRFNATPPQLVPVEQADGTFRIPDEQVTALQEFVDRYHVNAVLCGTRITPVQDPIDQRERLHAWLGSFDQAAAQLDRSHVLFYTYLKDEPNDVEEYQYVQPGAERYES